MIKQLLRIRVLQIIWATAGIGLLRLLVLLILVATALLGLLQHSGSAPNVYYLSGGYLLLMITIQIKRADMHFLKLSFDRYRSLLIIENLLLVSPLSLSLLYHQNWLLTICGILSAFIIPFISLKKSTKSLNTVVQERIPAACFEWKSGVREYLWVMGFLWLVAALYSYSVFVVPISILLLTILVVTFYEKGEPLQMILVFERGQQRFIHQKMVLHLRLFGLVLSPLILLFLFFHLEYWYVILAELGLLVSLLVYTILLKYATYRTDQQSSGSQAYALIGFLGVMVPIVFLPVVWAFSIYFYYKAQRNLKIYLNDFN